MKSGCVSLESRLQQFFTAKSRNLEVNYWFTMSRRREEQTGILFFFFEEES